MTDGKKKKEGISGIKKKISKEIEEGDIKRVAVLTKKIRYALGYGCFITKK
jgi:hypothetical protein